MKLSQKIRIYPTFEQEVILRKGCGTARYTYNWALNRWKELKSEGEEKVFKNSLKKEWNRVKPEWVYESPKDANQQPFTNLYNGLSRYFKRQGGFPTFKKKNVSNDSFYVSNDKAHITNNHIKLPLIGRVKLAERLRFRKKDVKINSYTVSRKADRWFVSVCMDIKDKVIFDKVNAEIKKKEEKSIDTNGVVGIDLGLNSFYTTSGGEKVEAPRPLRKNLKKLKRVSRQHSRKKVKGKNREKSRKKLARLHARIANIRKDFLHKQSHKICSENKYIVIEDLNVQNTLKNHKLALHIQDVSWGEFRRQLEYKSKKFCSQLVKADRFFASSKTCSGCGNVKEKLDLSEREYVCEKCHLSIDRDLNASINLLVYGMSIEMPSATRFKPVESLALADEGNDINETELIEASLRDNPYGLRKQVVNTTKLRKSLLIT